MPRGDEGVERVSAQIHNPAVGALDGVGQRRVGNVRPENPSPSGGGGVGEVGNVVVGVELVLEERDEVVGVRGEQRVFLTAGGDHREDVPIRDGESEGFEPSGAGFWYSGQDNVIVMSLEVLLERGNGLNLSRLAPKALVLVEMGSSPTSLFGQREKHFLALFGEP